MRTATHTLVMMKLGISEEIKAAIYQNCKILTTLLIYQINCIKKLRIKLGVIQQLRGQNFAILDPPTPPAWTVLYPERGQKQTFFDTILIYVVHVVIE